MTQTLGARSLLGGQAIAPMAAKGLIVLKKSTLFGG
jgi:hypothetical protein